MRFAFLAYNQMEELDIIGPWEFISYLNDTGDVKTVYLVVDSFGTDSCGPYTGILTLNGPGSIPNEKESWGLLKATYR